MIIGKLLGAKTIFIESITRVEQLSLSARLVLPFLDSLYVHWPKLRILYPNAQLINRSMERTKIPLSITEAS
jgi:hypothetical protein